MALFAAFSNSLVPLELDVRAALQSQIGPTSRISVRTRRSARGR